MANTSEQFINSTLDFISSLQFKDCLKESYYGFMVCFVIMTLCIFVGTPAHLWCLWFYFGSKGKIKDTQVFFLNHIFMEILYCIECSLEILNRFTINNHILWYVVYFSSWLSWSGRPLLQTCICIEQYLAVIHPVTFLKYKGIKYRIAVAVIVWLMACAYGVYEIYATVFPDFIVTSVFTIALVVILFCCVSVLFALKQPGPGDTHTTKPSGKKLGGNQQKRNAFNTIFSALLFIVFFYFPQGIIILFFMFGIQVNRLLLYCNIIPLSTSLNVLGVLIAPLMKLYKEGHFKYVKNSK